MIYELNCSESIIRGNLRAKTYRVVTIGNKYNLKLLRTATYLIQKPTHTNDKTSKLTVKLGLKG